MFVNVKVKMTGTNTPPTVSIERDGGITRDYGLNELRLSRIQSLFDEHQGRIYVDMENSTVELTHIKKGYKYDYRNRNQSGL